MLIVDRFEGEYAVCEYEDEAFIHIRRSLISLDVREGDVLELTGRLFTVDRAATEFRRKLVFEKMSRLFSNGQNQEA